MNPQIKKELNIILNAFLNFHLEKELKSQKVLNKLNEAQTYGAVVDNKRHKFVGWIYPAPSKSSENNKNEFDKGEGMNKK